MDQEHNGTASASVRTPTKSTGMMGKEVCLTLLFRIIRPHSVSVGVGGEQKRRKGFSRGLGKKEAQKKVERAQKKVERIPGLFTCGYRIIISFFFSVWLRISV
jgi:hypothetical protein